MPKRSIVVHYHNFHPSEQTQLYIDSVIQEIQHELPSGAIVKASFSKKNDIVKGILQVGSNAGPFFAAADATNLNDVTLKLVGQIRRRLDKWKKRRHNREGIKSIFKNKETEEMSYDLTIA